jgi:hypothetical protein
VKIRGICQSVGRDVKIQKRLLRTLAVFKNFWEVFPNLVVYRCKNFKINYNFGGTEKYFEQLILSRTKAYQTMLMSCPDPFEVGAKPRKMHIIK